MLVNELNLQDALCTKMKIEEAIVYVMVQRNGGMTTDQIADAINRQRLHIRKDGTLKLLLMNTVE